MECKNFRCSGEANGYPCCSSYCGYQYKQDLRQLEKYQLGLIEKKDLVDGLVTPWSEEKIAYYTNRSRVKN